MWFRIITGLLFFLAGFSNVAKAQPPVSQLIDQIKNELNFTELEAQAFLSHVTDKIRRLQIFLNILASSDNSIESKQTVEDFLLKEVFTEDALVNVSSKNNPSSTVKLPVKAYLNRLINLGTNNNYSYSSIELYFNPKYLKISDFYKSTHSGQYQMQIQVQQYFRGKKENTEVEYEDVTRKTIIGKIEESKDGTFQLKWQAIQVDHTGSVSENEFQEALSEFERFKGRYFSDPNKKDSKWSKNDLFLN
jgi:hypothetical protein